VPKHLAGLIKMKNTQLLLPVTLGIMAALASTAISAPVHAFVPCTDIVGCSGTAFCFDALASTSNCHMLCSDGTRVYCNAT
jgi:hypothetical protein